MKTILESAREKVFERLENEHLLKDKVFLRAKVLSAEEAIGNPEEYDFPLLKGKEKIIEADFKGCLGHAFTDMYGGFEGILKDIFYMEASNNFRRALQVATINALTNYWGLVKDTVHCKDGQPKICAKRSIDFFKENYPNVKRIVFIGYQPAFVDIFSKRYDLKIFDLDKKNIGKKRFGNIILAGADCTKTDIVKWADLVFATGSTIVNGTIDDIITVYSLDKVVFYGVTIAGTAELLDLKRICFIEGA